MRSKLIGTLAVVAFAFTLLADCSTSKQNPSVAGRPDITVAVKAAAAKDCGCGHCAAKGCEPCRGKNCYYCVAKALVTNDCGCGMCTAKGCDMCGPGCDVCKFHLAPVAASEKKE